MKRIWNLALGTAVLCTALLCGCALSGTTAPDSAAPTDPLTGQELRAQASEKGITVLRSRLTPDNRLEFLLPRAEQRTELQELLSKDFPQLAVDSPTQVEGGGLRFTAAFTPAAKAKIEEMALDQAVRTIRNRIDQFGVAEPDIRKQQGDRILIQLPGLTNVNRAVQLVEKSADLSFHLVRDDISQGYLPPGVAFYPMTGKHGEATNAKLALDSTPLLSGKEVADARPGFDNKNTSMVSLSFTPRGAALFEMATGEHVGKRLAIVLDGTIHSAPVIQEKIAGGTASISGHAFLNGSLSSRAIMTNTAQMLSRTKPRIFSRKK